MPDNPFVSLGDLTKPATTLVEKISDAVGGIFKPYQIVRVAKAEAEANRIAAESQIQVTDIQRRAMHRFLEEEGKKQANIEAITAQALPLLEEKSSPQDVADDWITNFFDKSRIVSDKDMQQLWARILAGEANKPGTFSTRTVNLLADLDKRDAELFTNLCGFGWRIGQLVPLVFDVLDGHYNRNGIDFSALTQLESLGLIKFDSFSGFRFTNLPKTALVSYFGKRLRLTFSNESGNSIDSGKVLLTNAGQELAPCCGAKPVEAFFDYVCKKWHTPPVIDIDDMTT